MRFIEVINLLLPQKVAVTQDAAAARAAYEAAVGADPRDGRLLFERDQLWKRVGVEPATRLAELQVLPLFLHFECSDIFLCSHAQRACSSSLICTTAVPYPSNEKAGHWAWGQKQQEECGLSVCVKGGEG